MVTLALRVTAGLRLNCPLAHAPTPVMLLTVSCTEATALAPLRVEKAPLPARVHCTVMVCVSVDTAVQHSDRAAAGFRETGSSAMTVTYWHSN